MPSFGRSGCFALFTLALVAAAAFAAQATAGEWIASTGTGCKVWNPNPAASETAKWSGDCKDGLAFGKGTVDWLRDGKPYERDEGTWTEGRQSGEGRQVWPAGEYTGELAEGLPHGRGRLLLGASRYEGAFVGGKPNGRGVLKNASGIFNGDWRDGCFSDGKRRAAIGISVQACH